MSAPTDNSRVDDGGPAFPNCHPSSEPGMTLRDWFAGQALAGGRARDTVPDWQLDAWFGKTATSIKREQIVARDAYALADAMLAARKRGDR